MASLKTETSRLVEYCTKKYIRLECAFSIAEAGHKCVLKVDSLEVEAISFSKKGAKHAAAKLILEKLKSNETYNSQNNGNSSGLNFDQDKKNNELRKIRFWKKKKLLAKSTIRDNSNNKSGNIPSGINYFRQFDAKQNHKAKKILLQSNNGSEEERVEMAIKALGCELKIIDELIGGRYLQIGKLQGCPIDTTFAGFPIDLHKRIMQYLLDVL